MPTLCKLLFTITLIVFLNNFSFAQALPELEKVKEIKLLEDSRDDVRKILAEYKLEDKEKQNYEDKFETEDSQIRVWYSEGKCEFEDEVSTDWEIKKDKVIQITIYPPNKLKINQIGLNLKKFRKEYQYTNRKDYIVYHHKESGVSVWVYENEVKSILFEPQKKYYLTMCDKNLAKRLFSTSSYFDPKYKKREFAPGLPNSIPNVESLDLSLEEITASCNDSENKSCSESVKVIAVFAHSIDRDNDTLVFKYDVTGGKVLPYGEKKIELSEKVLWDLSDVKPGIYTITAAVDDGCGFCGKTMTKTVVVKECPDCKKP